MAKDNLNKDFMLLEIIHTEHHPEFKTGITININKYKFLKELYNQFGKFTIDETDDSNDIQLITK